MAGSYPALLIPRVTIIPTRLSASDALDSLRDDLRDLGVAVTRLADFLASGEPRALAAASDLAVIGTRLDVLAGALGELAVDVGRIEDARHKFDVEEVYHLEDEVKDLTEENDALEADVQRLEEELAECRAAKKGKRGTRV